MLTLSPTKYFSVFDEFYSLRFLRPFLNTSSTIRTACPRGLAGQFVVFFLVKRPEYSLSGDFFDFYFRGDDEPATPKWFYVVNGPERGFIRPLCKRYRQLKGQAHWFWDPPTLAPGTYTVQSSQFLSFMCFIISHNSLLQIEKVFRRDSDIFNSKICPVTDFL